MPVDPRHLLARSFPVLEHAYTQRDTRLYALGLGMGSDPLAVMLKGAFLAAKAGLIGMAKALAQEEGRYGITVNCVAPGFMDTEMVQALSTCETIKERAVAAQPIKRAGHPDDVADAVAFLASERASFISGEVLHVTGGRYG